MASPKPAQKPAARSVVKAKSSPGAKAAAVQQKAANKQFAAASEIARRKAITKPMGAKFSGSHPTPAPMRTMTSSNPSAQMKQMNPLEKMLTPGSGGIASAMAAGAKRKKGVLRP